MGCPGGGICIVFGYNVALQGAAGKRLYQAVCTWVQTHTEVNMGVRKVDEVGGSKPSSKQVDTLSLSMCNPALSLSLLIVHAYMLSANNPKELNLCFGALLARPRVALSVQMAKTGNLTCLTFSDPVTLQRLQ